MRKYFLGCLAFVFMAVLMVSSPVYADGQKTILVLDASGSMWGQIDGKAKITIARDVIAGMVKDWPKDQQIGLMAYGHRTKGDCGDIETIIPAGKLDAAAFNTAVKNINPKGKTPLTAAVKLAAEKLKYTEDKATVILISDGKETCNADPCAVATALEKAGVDFTAHVISFDVAEKDSIAQLRCMAKNTGGEYLTAKNASELKTALRKTVEKTLEPAKQVVFEKPKKCAHLTNGSFEKGPDPGRYTPYNSGNSSIPGWDIIKGQIDHIGSHLPSSDGGRHVDLDGSPGAGGVSQKIKTSPGVTYHLSFDVSANTECALSIKRMRVSAAGKIKEFALQSSAWKKETITFTAKSKQTLLKFESLDGTNHSCGPRLDNVKVSCEQESFFNWVEYISKGNRFSVVLNKTADKFDDSNYTGWRTDPLGAAKGGETYSCIYSGGVFSCTGFYQTTGKVETVNLDRWPADPRKKKISIWGLILTFDEKGNVFSLDASNHNNNYGLIGELQKSSGN